MERLSPVWFFEATRMTTINTVSRFKTNLAHPLSRARTQYVASVRQSNKRDILPHLCFGVVLASALFVSMVSLRAWQGGSPLAEGTTEAPLELRLAGVSPRDRDSFLAELSRDEERKLAGQIHFVSNIIRSTHKKLDRVDRLATSIVTESIRAGYDPLFVAAVIKSESTFNTQARSNQGALGLMQVLPSTGEHISKVSRISWLGGQKLHEPQYNIRLGISYLKYLEKMYNGNREHALIAYNWGPGRLSRALKSQERIPGSPITYARKIMRNHSQWHDSFTLLARQYGTYGIQVASVADTGVRKVAA